MAADDDIEPLGAAEIRHLGRTITAVGAEEDVHAWPVSPNGADEVAQKAAHLAPGGRAAGGVSLAVGDDDRLGTTFIIVGVEGAELLAAMDGIEGVVDVEGDAARQLAEAGAVEVDHGLADTEQLARPRQVFQAGDCRLRTQRSSIRQAAAGEFKGRVVARAGSFLGVLVARGDHQHSEAQDVGHAVDDAPWCARIGNAGGETVGDAEAGFDLAQRQHAAVEVGDDGLAADRSLAMQCGGQTTFGGLGVRNR